MRHYGEFFECLEMKQDKGTNLDGTKISKEGEEEEKIGWKVSKGRKREKKREREKEGGEDVDEKESRSCWFSPPSVHRPLDWPYSVGVGWSIILYRLVTDWHLDTSGFAADLCPPLIIVLLAISYNMDIGILPGKWRSSHQITIKPQPTILSSSEHSRA
ncbi:hypothetical protein ASPWEDRAFT_28192 [Aspergillus wentii DTO 134E9]|uniref:Uncharacterized protein n=1 Tax=Aspergillus wentii DTO 134E9 TaxID=1073089 RepID=A0A1L9RKX0_ASPWE|nr:uncharacterized protein ASPWEDRAFT_28192 [Aspergillus wentii DTO 134E9]OJJ35572.1 hypothetical protein ASPWEDRAFT_28192 [Aspergillus wentii DTO 134E9]